jgi:hypothetical protein
LLKEEGRLLGLGKGGLGEALPASCFARHSRADYWDSQALHKQHAVRRSETHLSLDKDAPDLGQV